MFTYRPYCDGCNACVPLRVPVDRFAPNRSQRRSQRQHGGLLTRVLKLCFLPEHMLLQSFAAGCRAQLAVEE
eukprot:5976-Eustigmatos_ZCMA.PRE.1